MSLTRAAFVRESPHNKAMSFVLKTVFLDLRRIFRKLPFSIDIAYTLGLS
ncbi:hypothetical protein TRIP_C20080 [Candidatus Zixiibacteriota bacterium]|nr:hypothetical protein TRIP_C20080 [candidate division Zixibacteria bacterium]